MVRGKRCSGTSAGVTAWLCESLVIFWPEIYLAAKHGLLLCIGMCQLCSTGSWPPTCQAAGPVLGHVAETDRAICLHVLTSVCAAAGNGRRWHLLLLVL